MNSRVFCVIVLVSLVPQVSLMCLEPSYRTGLQYHIEGYADAPFILGMYYFYTLFIYYF